MNKAKVQQTTLLAYMDNKDIVNDRTALLAEVWRRYGWNDSQSLEENLRKVPSAESVSRRVRELHELGMIQYSQKELERRDEAFKNEVEEHRPAAVSWLND